MSSVAAQPAAVATREASEAAAAVLLPQGLASSHLPSFPFLDQQESFTVILLALSQTSQFRKVGGGGGVHERVTQEVSLKLVLQNDLADKLAKSEAVFTPHAKGQS